MMKRKVTIDRKVTIKRKAKVKREIIAKWMQAMRDGTPNVKIGTSHACQTC